MSNFWFNEDAFQLGHNEGSEDDIAGAMFDDFARRPQDGPSSSFEQPSQGHQQHLAPPMQPQNDDTIYEGKEYQQIGASGQMHAPNFEGKNSPMYARQPESLSQAAALALKTGHLSSPKVDPLQQKEQLSRMRQQVMHQQMLHRQQQQHQQQHQQQQQQQQQQQLQQQHSHDGGQGSQQRAPEQVGGENYGIPNSVNGVGGIPQEPFNNMVHGPMPGENPQNQGQFGSRPNSAALIQNSYGQGSQGQINPMLAGQTGQAQGVLGSKPSPAQIAQLQHELFQMTLSDFMARRGTPITQFPVINNKKVNLLALQMLGRKIGGMQVVLKNLQMLNQNSSKITEWSSICHKLGLFEGFDFQTNHKAKQQVEKQLASCYLQYVLPYEQYTLTEEGQKDIQSRRLQFQRQIFMRLQQQQMQKPQTALSTPQSQQAQTPMSTSIQAMPNEFQSQKTEFHNLSESVLRQMQSPEVMKSPPNRSSSKASNLANASTPISSIPMKGTQMSPGKNESPRLQLKRPSTSSPQSRNSKRASQSQQKTPKMNSKKVSNAQDSTTPNTIRKYVPIKKQLDSYGKMFLKGISELGDEIDLTKPVYLFAPELGSLNIHALIMALKSYTPNNPGEVSSALNTLLVTTTDASFHFSLTDAPELLDALVNLGTKLLDQITHQVFNKHDYEVEFAGKPDVIDKIFQKYVGNDSMRGEDVNYVVDSLTGEVIEDEDSEMEIDELFTPEETTSASPCRVEVIPKITEFQLPDFMSSLRNFRDENKYHFSKVQTKGASNDNVFLVDSLITTTMTIRNLSFTDESSDFMSYSPSFKKFIFKIVKSVAANLEAFTFERKRLCLLKDCLLMLDRNANNMELDTLEEAFLVFILLSSFGPNLTDGMDRTVNKASIPSCSLATYSYLPFAVDCFVKILVREPKNKALFQALLSGSINNSAFSNVNGIKESITDDDVNETLNLLDLYLGSDKEARKEGILYTRCFKLFMSVIPLTMSGVEFTSFILQRSSTVLQALFGAKLLIDSISLEDLNEPLVWLPFSWLVENIRPLLFNLAKNTISSITESVKFLRQDAEHKVLSYVGFKSLVVINSLLAHAVVLKTAIQRHELESPENLGERFLELVDLYRVQPESDFVLNTIIASSIDLDVAQEIVRFHELLQKLS